MADNWAHAETLWWITRLNNGRNYRNPIEAQNEIHWPNDKKFDSHFLQRPQEYGRRQRNMEKTSTFNIKKSIKFYKPISGLKRGKKIVLVQFSVAGLICSILNIIQTLSVFYNFD